MKKYMIIGALLACLLPVRAAAHVRPAQVFTDNMVLQRDKPVRVWGTADPGEKVSVLLKKQRRSVLADARGRWEVVLDPLPASSKPVRFRISGKENTLELKDVLSGEVWLASGQSNMEYSMHAHLSYKKPKRGDPDRLLHEYVQADNPLIRLLNIEKRLDCDSLPTVGWRKLDQESLAPFSAAAFFFAKTLQDSLGVPVGVIASSWGGTTAESWTPKALYQDNPLFPEYKGWSRVSNGEEIGLRYEKMIEPMAPLSLRGFLWYQGEENVFIGDAENYTDKMKTLIEGWRDAWQDRDLPFLYVQLAPYTYSQARWVEKPVNWQQLPRIWDAQAEVKRRVPLTGMVVCTDIPDDVTDIHPSYKWIVGERLARLALVIAYGRKEVAGVSPSFKEMHIEGDKVVISFKDVGSGLVTRDGKAPDSFRTAKISGNYHDVPVELRDDKIYIDRSLLGPELRVRFGWDETAQPNLMSREGLPVEPFYRVVPAQ